MADFVIDTSGSVQASRARTDEVLVAICERVGIDPSLYAVRSAAT